MATIWTVKALAHDTMTDEEAAKYNYTAQDETDANRRARLMTDCGYTVAVLRDGEAVR